MDTTLCPVSSGILRHALSDGILTPTAILFYKISESGAGKYERLMLLVIFIQNLLAGVGFARVGTFPPLLPLWGTPALMAIGYARGGI